MNDRRSGGIAGSRAMKHRFIELLSAPKSIPLLGLGVAILFWLLDSVIDMVIFGGETTFLDSLVAPEPSELWMRILVTVLLMLFSWLIQGLLKTQRRTNDELHEYKTHLEELVVKRTRELEDRNRELTLEVQERKRIEGELERLATSDPLTMLFNRRKFDDILEYEMDRDRRYRYGLSLIFCDIDHFKNVNDRYGHDVGDGVLRQVASIIRESVRESDVVARWGGEEFVLLVPSSTAEVARNIAEKIRREIETREIPEVGHITASFGVTHFLGSDDRQSILKRADQALYRAKQNGRNRVELLT